MIRVALADDHAVLREGLRMLLELEPDISVVGEAGDGLEALALARRTRPDVLLLDLSMPGLGGLEVARRLGRTAPQIRVVFLTGCEDETRVRQAFQLGAAGYVVKGAGCAELVEAVRAAFVGRRYLSPPFAARGVGAFLDGGGADGIPSLTARELEVLHLSVEGLTARGIAARLSISPRTAEAHKCNLMRKLAVRSQTELVRFAIANGLIQLDDA